MAKRRKLSRTTVLDEVRAAALVNVQMVLLVPSPAVMARILGRPGQQVRAKYRALVEEGTLWQPHGDGPTYALSEFTPDTQESIFTWFQKELER